MGNFGTAPANVRNLHVSDETGLASMKLSLADLEKLRGLESVEAAKEAVRDTPIERFISTKVRAADGWKTNWVISSFIDIDCKVKQAFNARLYDKLHQHHRSPGYLGEEVVGPRGVFHHQEPVKRQQCGVHRLPGLTDTVGCAPIR